MKCIIDLELGRKMNLAIDLKTVFLDTAASMYVYLYVCPKKVGPSKIKKKVPNVWVNSEFTILESLAKLRF